MSKIKLTGSNSGYVEIASAADAGNLTLTLPTSGTAILGNAGNVFSGITTTGQLDINGSIDVSSTSVFNDDLTLTGASYNVVWDKSDNQLEFGDNAKLSFGASSDLQLYHNGTDTQIQNITGGLYIGNIAGNSNHVYISTRNNFVVQTNLNEAAIQCFANGGVELFYNSSLKLNTTNTGAIVTGICTATSFSGSGEGLTRTTPYSHRNIIINGDFQIAQRSDLNTAVTATTDSEYLSVDRFRWRTYGGAGRASFTQVSGDYPSSDFRYSLKAICTTVNSSEDQYDQAIGYHVEGYDMQRLGWGRSNPKNCTLSFWAKTSVAGTYCVSFRQGAATRSQIKEYTLSANTWTKVELTITGDSDSTWLNSDYTTNGKGILIEWNLGKSNSKNTSTVNTWITGNKVASNNQVRWIATLGATFSLTGVQLEVGSVATPFEHRSYGDTLMDCYRYYVKLYTNTSDFPFGYGYKYGGTTHAVSVQLPTRLRTTPTCTFGNLRIRGGNTGGVNNYETVTSLSGMTFSHANFQSFTVNTNTNNANIGQTVLLTNAVSNSTSYINFDAEL